MNNYFKNHPLYINQTQNIKRIRMNFFDKYKNELGEIFKRLHKNSKILEIWFGQWNFIHFCKEQWFENYTWIDIDDTFIKQHEKEFKNYKFFNADIIDFLNNNKWFDVIFMSHVFEHLDEKEANQAIMLLYSSLKEWWYWINYMPNADAYLNASTLRYIDITHKKLYNPNSLEQIILTNNVKFDKIQYFNTLPAINPYIKLLFKIIHPIFLRATKIYFYGMWFSFSKIYTSEILSIAKK